MKCSVLIAVVFGLVASNAFADGERLFVLANCSTDNTSEGGYRVVVHSGGFTGLTTAKIEESTFAGSQELQTLEVRSFQTAGTLNFSDSPGRGQDFQLVIDLHSGNSIHREYPARFGANTQMGRISGRLTCKLQQFEM